jgi:hypothetical protein
VRLRTFDDAGGDGFDALVGGHGSYPDFLDCVFARQDERESCAIRG